MSNKDRFLKKLLFVKHKLPYNGDWLFVTESPIEENNEQDIACEYDKPDEILKNLKSDNLELAQLTYERAKDYESFIYNSANHIRDKAKTLLSTASFTSALLLIVLSFFLTTIVSFNWWVIVIESILILFLAEHLIRALAIANDAMTREEFIRQSPSELLSISSTEKGDSIKAYDKLTSQIVAYASQTHEYIRKRGNKLILAQTAFRYGLIYFVIIFIVLLISSSWYKPQDPWSKLVELEEKILTLTVNNQDKEIEAINELTYEISNLRKNSEQATKNLEKIQKTIKKLGNKVPQEKIERIR